MKLLEMMAEAGLDIEATLHRFMGNEGLLERFVKKFLQDPTYEQLMQAIEAHDLPNVEIAAHTLKGTAANLGMQMLSEKSAALVDAVREGEPSPERLAALCAGISEEYEKIISLIAKID